MTMVEIHDINGERLIVNLDQVSEIRPIGDRFVLSMASGYTYVLDASQAGVFRQTMKIEPLNTPNPSAGPWPLRKTAS